MSLTQELSAVLNGVHKDDFLIEQRYQYTAIFLSKILPDQTNPRFFPAIIMSDNHAHQMISRKLTKKQIMNIYDAKDKVLIGKSCIVNGFEYGSFEWRKANDSIQSIIELAANVAVSEIIQVPTIFPIDGGSFQILTGHRRFFAMIYANGIDGAAHFKVYQSKPLLPKTKQFQENASREDLPQYGKLSAFQDAMLEIETLSNIRKSKGGKAVIVKEIASILGISMGAYDNYNVLTRYPCIIEEYKTGNNTSFVKMKRTVLQVETQYKSKYNLTILNINHKREIEKQLIALFDGNTTSKKKATSGSYKVEPIGSAEILKRLLTTNVLELDTGIDWDNIDWEDSKTVNSAVKNLVHYLSNN
jgi:hypothetical protein